MSVAVAHQVSPTGHIALKEAAQQAHWRQTSLAVIHVAESLDLDITESYRSGVSDDIEKALAETTFSDISWDLHLTTGEDVADIVLDQAKAADAEVLVIGARRRSPVGKFLLGSVTQSIILDAPVPVLVVKADV